MFNFIRALIFCVIASPLVFVASSYGQDDSLDSVTEPLQRDIQDIFDDVTGGVRRHAENMMRSIERRMGAAGRLVRQVHRQVLRTYDAARNQAQNLINAPDQNQDARRRDDSRYFELPDDQVNQSLDNLNEVVRVGANHKDLLNVHDENSFDELFGLDEPLDDVLTVVRKRAMEEMMKRNEFEQIYENRTEQQQQQHQWQPTVRNGRIVLP